MPPSPHPVRSIIPALACLIALAGCGEPDPATRDGSPTAEAPLPGPRPAGGAVTDMPAAPGPGAVPLAGTSPAPAHDSTALQGTPLPPLEENPEAGLVPLVAVDPAAPASAATIVSAPLSAATPAPAPAAASAAAPEDPRDLLRGYYTAINARDFAAAHAAWADAASAPGRTPEQFAAAFAGAASIELTLGAPRPADGGAGTALVEVPVTVTTTRSDGSVQHQAGRYTLRRSPDGAGPRAWRIEAVDLRDAAR